MGVGYYKFRLVDRYRSRRNTYFSGAFTFPSALENGNQPLCRSNDNFRGSVRGNFPGVSHGTCVDGLLGNAHSESVRFVVGELQLTASLGRIRDLNLLRSEEHTSELQSP